MAPLPSPPFDIVLVGAGRVGTALSLLLQKRGHRIVGVASRSEDSARTAAERLGSPVVGSDELPRCDVVLLGVPEPALEQVVSELGSAASGRVLVHVAGSTGTAPLRGASGPVALCALHPMQACPDVDTAVARLPGSAWGVTCSEGALQWARRLITEDLDGDPVAVAEEDRPLWHAAAVTTSNGISALMATGEALLASIGIEGPDRVLGPIAAGTVANAREMGGGAAALTGPVVRGEADVIRRHLDAVADGAPALVEAYVHTLRSIVSAAAASHRITEQEAAALMSLLERR